MNRPDPLSRNREELATITEKIVHPDSPVGIDASYTHAVIITYLQQITERLDQIEAKLDR